jgi:hypothetical protein
MKSEFYVSNCERCKQIITVGEISQKYINHKANIIISLYLKFDNSSNSSHENLRKSKVFKSHRFTFLNGIFKTLEYNTVRIRVQFKIIFRRYN